VKWVEFSPDGARVVTASTDDTARIWDARTGRLVAPLLQHTRTVEQAAFSPDGRRVVTSCLDRTAQIWDAVTGRALTPPLRHDNGGDWVAFSADGRRVMTGCGSGARFWDAGTGRPLTEWLKGGEYWGARLDTTAERVALGSKDGVLRVWSLPRAPVPVPGWFLEFAEAVAGIRLTEQGATELVPAGRHQELAKQIPSGTTGNDYEQLARRFLADP
jgi:WD40 repeat protein